jgi:hypothetical protein
MGFTYLQIERNHWLGATAPKPCSICPLSSTNLLNPPEKNSWVCHWNEQKQWCGKECSILCTNVQELICWYFTSLEAHFKVIHVHRRSSFCQETSPYKVRHTDLWNIQWTSQWLQIFQGSQERYNFVKDFKPRGAFLGSKRDPKLSLVTTVDFVIVGLHHIYSIQNNK